MNSTYREKPCGQSPRAMVSQVVAGRKVSSRSSRLASRRSSIPLYEAADLFIYPSLCESFGFPLVEAMASGLPVIAADLPLNREMCGEAAVYYPAKDPAALAREIRRVAGDEPLRARLSSAGRTRSRRFSWDDHVDSIMAVVREAAPG